MQHNILYVGSSADMYPTILFEEEDFIYITLEPNLPYWSFTCPGSVFQDADYFLSIIIKQLAPNGWTHTNNITDLPWIFKRNKRSEQTLTFYHSTDFTKKLPFDLVKQLKQTTVVYCAGHHPSAALIRSYCPAFVTLFYANCNRPNLTSKTGELTVLGLEVDDWAKDFLKF